MNAATHIIKQQIVEAACPQQGFDNYEHIVSEAFTIADEMRMNKPQKVVQAIVNLYHTAKFKKSASSRQKWNQLKNTDASTAKLIEQAFEQRVRDTAGAFSLPNGKMKAKCAELFMWLPKLLKAHQVNDLNRFRHECLTEASRKWNEQKRNLFDFIGSLQKGGINFDSWTLEMQTQFLEQVRNVKLTRFDLARGAIRAQSILMLPLFERSGLQLLFANLRKANVWISQGGQKRKRDDNPTPLHHSSKKAKKLDDRVMDIILDDHDSLATPTQSLMSPAQQQVPPDFIMAIPEPDDLISLFDNTIFAAPYVTSNEQDAQWHFAQASEDVAAHIEESMDSEDDPFNNHHTIHDMIASHFSF